MAGDSLGDFVQAEHNTLAAQRKAVEPYVSWLGQRWLGDPGFSLSKCNL